MQNECDSMSIEPQITHTIIIITQKYDDCKETLLLLLRHRQKYEKDEGRASKTSVTCNLSAQILIHAEANPSFTLCTCTLRTHTAWEHQEKKLKI